MEPLERAYRRLLLAYPRHYRRERGAEILTTLLDAAAPDQRRPTRRDALDLVMGGLRRRFAIPRGPLPAAVAIMVALLAALFATAGAGQLAWRAATPPPDLTDARAAVETAIPLPPAGDPIRYDRHLSLGADGAVVPAPAAVGYSFAVPASTVSTEIRDARDRLLAAGWEVDQIRDDYGVLTFSAARGDQVVSIGGFVDAPDVAEPIWANVHGRTPVLFTTGMLAAGAAAAVAGWLVAGWGMRRARHPDGRLRAVVTVFAGIGLLAGAPLLLAAAYYGVNAVTAGGWSPTNVLFPIVALGAVRPLDIFAGAWLLAALLAAALPPRGSRGVQPWRLGLWTAAGAHLAFAAAWCLVVGLYLGRLAASGGDRHGMLHGEYDPKELVPFGMTGLNPFTWVYALVSLLFLLSFLASPGLLSVSVPLLVTTRRTVAAAAGRTAWRVLLFAAVTALALPLVTVTPLGRDALTWWLD
ncbi:hypothetical protein ACTMTJ_13770 [Phytohabitans sp. LJ34]|uniref:hypothetical protein n=1 Tax=Phytohabitans sp. LJ34 TaxID=3452217 RepID=UPI003F8998F3